MGDRYEKIAFLSESQGKVKLEILNESETIVALWENIEGSILETLFDKDGAVIRQRISNSGSVSEDAKMFLSQISPSEVKSNDYSDVKLRKPCPKCDGSSHKRIINNSEGGISIMPMYICERCNEKGFHITSKYLEYLVENNTLLFEEKDIIKLRQNKEQFISELQEYVSRIFSAKHINHIK